MLRCVRDGPATIEVVLWDLASVALRLTKAFHGAYICSIHSTVDHQACAVDHTGESIKYISAMACMMGVYFPVVGSSTLSERCFVYAIVDTTVYEPRFIVLLH